MPAGPRRELLQARAAFVSACGWGSRRSILASLERRDRQLVQALRDGQQVVLWFEHDLYDQLQLVDVLALAAPDAPELIVVGSFPGRPAFRGLGELTADDLETLWPARVPGQDTLAAAVSVWAALRHPDPSALAEAARADLPGLPFLGPALLRLLEELPAARRRPVRNRTAGAAGDCGGGDDAGRRVPGRSGPGGGAVPRRRVVLPRAGRPRRRPGAPGRDAGRRPAAAAPAAGRHKRLRPAAAPADRPGRAGPGRPGGPGGAAGPGSLAGRHAPHRGRGLALGSRRRPARQALTGAPGRYDPGWTYQERARRLRQGKDQTSCPSQLRQVISMTATTLTRPRPGPATSAAATRAEAPT